jgi:uncharacterized protein YjiS (DUF1127 family)
MIMATTTSATDFVGHVDTNAGAAPKRGFFARILDRLIASRMRQAKAQVDGYLAQMSDERLQDLGFTSDQAKAVRAKASVPASYLS